MGRVISHSGAEEDWRNGASESVVAIHHSGVADGGLIMVGISANEFHPFHTFHGQIADVIRNSSVWHELP